MVLSGCASRKYVRTQVGTLQGTLQPQITEVSNATKENAERIDSVDKKADQGIAAAATADQKAVTAQGAAQTAQTAANAAGQQAQTANQGVQQANNRINTVETRLNSLNDNYTSSQMETVTFKLNSAVLSDDAKSTLDKVAGGFGGAATGYMIELQGFTDSTGSENYNIGLSQRRVEAVQRYLVSKSIPLYRISVVGLGEDKPVADNKTRAGRDQNRRVEIQVLKSASGGRTTND
jgi:outer membrane protein OmpA-like peptidoglycan-associated protein